MKKFVLFIIILSVGIALGMYLQKKHKTQKIEKQVQTDANQGVQKANTAAADLKEAVHEASDMATNVAAQVKADAQKAANAATNVIGEVKQKLN